MKPTVPSPDGLPDCLAAERCEPAVLAVACDVASDKERSGVLCRHPSSGEVSCIIEAVADVLTCAFSSVSSATCKLSLNVQPIKNKNKHTHTHTHAGFRQEQEASKDEG